jgi:Niemann-Pick C1 protein
MRGNCGGLFTPLPCANNSEAIAPDTDSFRALLVDTCGTDYLTGPVCCDNGQLDTLVEQVKRAEIIIASCPACWSNFLQFWCSFTCSPNQSTFVNITTVDGSNSVESTDYWVGENFGSQFFDSCKNIKFGASNGFAMEFIGGGAKDWHSMVSYMGKKMPGLGSPFQIDFPPVETTVPQGGLDRYNDDGRPCNDTDAAYRCSCVDCEPVCPVLPPAPSERPQCYVGLLRCWSFALLMTYASLLLGGTCLVLAKNRQIGLGLQRFFGIHLDQTESNGLYERLALSEEDDQDENLLDPDYTPRRYWLNSRLQNWFYYQGLFCARHPYLVILASLGFVSLCSLGWSRFVVERDPVHLWVSPSSTALQQKKHFDENFSPFYRTTQLFFVSEAEDEPFASTERMESLFALESEIKTLKSDYYNDTLEDICFHPTGEACIIQSVTGYWASDPFDPDYWQDQLRDCTNQPSLCLPEFQQPLKPDMVMGGYKDNDYLTARTFIVTYVLRNSVDNAAISRAQHWERTLLNTVLNNLNERPEWKGVRISFTTEVIIILIIMIMCLLDVCSLIFIYRAL